MIEDIRGYAQRSFNLLHTSSNPLKMSCTCCDILIQVLAGHEAPVSNLAFNPMKALLYSSSWDKTVKVWDIFTQRSAKETLPIGSDGMQSSPHSKNFLQCLT